MAKFIQMLLAILLYLNISFASDFKVDKSHSNIAFNVTHMVVATVSGKFNEFDVNLKFDEDNLSDSEVKAIISTASIDTDNERRDKHLRSDDFFNAETYPELQFASSKIEKTEKGYLAHVTLTIRDVTKEISLPFIVKGPVKDKWDNTRIGVSASLTINRQDFGVKWNDTLDGGGLVVSDEVNVIIDAEFIQDNENS